ncbi:hypothetical protein [Ktedonospora formicarum]|uniref:ParB/Sulfiredoxin domain-containing protein n=1 Tax=Ktedonospora formicarum TaxID=2778364 RepID=A0A8J3I649_9CHLR|nr:hypothetical protein [Ktedonospora formicarum]GHO47565.1 hypothetical protein KSX_57280 [Ktedonospora formicarum]
MRTVRPVSEAEMVALFLATEYPSSRTHQHILQVLQREEWPPRLIEQPNLHDAQENAQRRSILRAYRGYGKTPDSFESLPLDVEYLDYFEGFPLDVRWERAMLSQQELEQVQYIEYDYWVELSGGSRLPRDARKKILAGDEVFGVSHQGVLQMAEAFHAGVQFPTLILVGKNRESPLVVLEGHMRLTAMVLAAECIPTELEVMVGFSEQIERWGCY